MSEFTFLTLHFGKDVGETTPKVATIKVRTESVEAILEQFNKHQAVLNIPAFNGELVVVGHWLVDMIRVTPGRLVVEKPAEVPPVWTPAEVADAEAA